MESSKHSGNRLTGLYKLRDVFGVTQMFNFHCNPPGGVVVMRQAISKHRCTTLRKQYFMGEGGTTV